MLKKLLALALFPVCLSAQVLTQHTVQPQDFNDARYLTSTALFLPTTGGTLTGRLGVSYTNSATPGWMTWTTPVFNQSVADATTVVQSSTAQGDPYVTPIQRIVSSDSGVNDSVPLYLYHNCNWTVALTSAPCVGEFVVAQNNPGDRHNGLWASNPIAIQYQASVNSLTYGVETNVFNMTNQDAGAPSNPNGAMSFIFGVAATMGGNAGSHGTAAFMATDTNANAFWWDGLWVQRAKYAAVEAGPIGGNSGLQWSLVSNPTGSAGVSNNYGSVPTSDIAAFWNGSASVLEVMKRQFLPGTGTNPVVCWNYTFSTWLGHQFCDNGAVVFLPKSGTQALRITPDADGEADAAIAVTNAANSAFTFLVQKNGTATISGPLEVKASLQVDTGVSQAAGLKHKRFGATCTTAATAAAVCTTSYAWTTTFADASYTPVCWGVTPSGSPILTLSATQTASAVVVQVQAATAVASGFSGVYCIAMHD